MIANSGSAGTIQLNHEWTRIDTNETDFILPYLNQPPNDEPEAISANLFSLSRYSYAFVSILGFRLHDSGSA